MSVQPWDPRYVKPPTALKGRKCYVIEQVAEARGDVLLRESGWPPWDAIMRDALVIWGPELAEVCVQRKDLPGDAMVVKDGALKMMQEIPRWGSMRARCQQVVEDHAAKKLVVRLQKTPRRRQGLRKVWVSAGKRRPWRRTRPCRETAAT